MGTVIIIFLKLTSYKDGNTRNLCKFDYIMRILKTFTDARKYNLTNNLRFFRPVMKVNI